MLKTSLFVFFFVIGVFAQASKQPKNLGSAISKNSLEYVAKYLAEGQSPAQSEWGGFGEPYLLNAIDNIEKYKNNITKKADAVKIVELMVQADTDKMARNQALMRAVTFGGYRFLEPLLSLGADVNYSICQDIGLGLGKKTPWTVLDFTGGGTDDSSMSGQYYNAKAAKYLMDHGAVGGSSLENYCQN